MLALPLLAVESIEPLHLLESLKPLNSDPHLLPGQSDVSDQLRLTQATTTFSSSLISG
jgi:hypothetical protein